MCKVALVTPHAVVPEVHGAAKRVMSFFSALDDMSDVQILMVDGLFRSGRQETTHNFIRTGYFGSKIASSIFSSSVVQFEFPYFPVWILMLRLLGKRVFLDLHNVEFDVANEMRKLDPSAASRATARAIPKLISSLPIIVYIFELLSVWFSEMIFCVSDKDKVRLVQLYRVNPSKVTVVPNSVPDTFFETVPPIRISEKTVIFVGSQYYAPNRHAIKVLVDHIVPKVTSNVRDAVFVVVGSDPPREKLDSSVDSVRYLGVVEDVRPYLAGAKVAVAPIFFGGGTRFKIIEYMAQAKAVVSTKKGMEGLSAVPGRDFILAEDLDSFSESVSSLLLQRNTKMESQAKLTASLYSYTKVKALIQNIYHNYGCS